MARLSGVRLPEESRHLRRPPRGKLEDAEFLERFDRHTLFYDVFHEPKSATIRIIAPSLATQKRLVKQMVLKVDGHIIDDPQLNFVSPRTSEIIFPSPVESPGKLRVLHGAAPRLNAQVRINSTATENFRGRNALVAISKNNRLEWIKDWLTYHVRVHGADAVVLIDNGSDAYPPRQLLRTMRSVEGIEEAEVISAPYPFGPKGVDRMSVNSKFLHLSALHIAHLRFLAEANAVLSIDIDELVTKPGDQSVFEAVKGTEEGFLSLPGTWRYARRPGDAKTSPRHADHVLMRKGKDLAMQPKWCVDPLGPMAGKYWRTHGILPAKRTALKGFGYLHCRQITTNWDYDRSYEPEELFEAAPETEALRRVFGVRELFVSSRA